MNRITNEQKKRVKELLKQMTLDEKIGQMNQASISIVGGFDVSLEEMIEMVSDGRISKVQFEKMINAAKKDYHEDDIRAGEIGSMIMQDPEKANELQRIAVEESRLGIPLMFGFDVIHGFCSVYPIAIAEAGTFDTELFERTARMAAKESRTQGVHWHFAPMIDVARDARWGRVSEGPGEDPYLVSEFAKAKVRGLQDDRTSTENYVAACLKHYVAYGACESGRDYNSVSMADSMLYNTYLPPFQEAVKEGAATVMAAFNDLNGVPCTVNKFTVRKILKEKYDFQGFVVSDAHAIRECVTHGIALDDEDAGIQAVMAGLDMDMGTGIYRNKLKAAVESGMVPEEVINEATERILSVKMWLGLFDQPYVDEKAVRRYDILPDEHVELALESAEKSIVLLKNEHQILPLKKTQRISLVGQLADMPEEVIGAWAMSWRKQDCVSIWEGMKSKAENIEYFPCGGPTLTLNEEEIAHAAAFGDVIVAVVGELVSMSGEAASRADIRLSGDQRELLRKLKATGKPVVALLMNGRPLALEWEHENIPAIVECWHLGIQMGNAVANILFGEKIPEGKLASSFPIAVGQCPIYYNHFSTGRPGGRSKFTSRYLDASHEALYPFGYGLSYTTFAYSNNEVWDTGDILEIKVDVLNTGECEGIETVQVYIQDITASIVRPVKELKGFKKVLLKSGETKTVVIEIEKQRLGFYDQNGTYVLEEGMFNIYIGGDSNNCLGVKILIENMEPIRKYK